MSENVQIPIKGDPSDVIQLFPKYNLQLLCCRYWWLKRWEFRELSFPYWRIYYNTKNGASLFYNGIEYRMDADKLYVIAPNTSYATQLFNQQIPTAGYALEGGRISSKYVGGEQEVIEHLFIHFNLGMPYDNVEPGIFSFNLSDHMNDKLNVILDQLSTDAVHFNFYSFLSIQSLIGDLLSEIDKDYWTVSKYDYRILEVLNIIEKEIQSDLSNDTLASAVNLATNSFTRLFSQEIGISPQRFVKKRRIDLACVQLHHSDVSIDQIALNCGFANRYHFTRIFTQITGISPSRYRKEFGIK